MSAAIPRFEAVLTDEHGISSNFRINVRLKPYDSRRSWLYEVPMMEHRGFTNELWHSITSIYNEILVHYWSTRSCEISPMVRLLKSASAFTSCRMQSIYMSMLAR